MSGQPTKIDDQIAHRLIAVGGILLERLLDDAAQLQRHIVAKRRRRVVEDGVDDVQVRLTRERPPAGQHLVQDDAEGEHVTSGIEAPPLRLLRRQIVDRPENDSHTTWRPGHRLRLAAGVIGHLGQTKVRQLGIAVPRNQNVLRLDVAMQDAGVVRRRERVRHASQQFDDLAPCPRFGSSPRAERSTIDELGHQVVAALELGGLVDRDNVGMIERRERAHFATESMARLIALDRSQQELDRDRPVQPGVGRSIDLAHATRADHGFNAIRPDERS